MPDLRYFKMQESANACDSAEYHFQASRAGEMIVSSLPLFKSKRRLRLFALAQDSAQAYECVSYNNAARSD